MYRSDKVTTKAVYDIETNTLLDWEGYDYDGPWALAEGAPTDTPDTLDEGGEGGQEGGEDYFLTVDDRTRYKTQDEAIEGYKQASQQILSLTPWQQTAADYGLSNPEDLASLVDELVELRAKANAVTPNPSGPTATPAAPTNLDPNSPEGKQASANANAVKWLKEHGVEAGLVPKTEIDKIAQQLEGLTKQNEVFQQERAEQRMTAGRSWLNAELKTAGLFPTDPKDTAGIKNAEGLSSVLENAITNWMNLDQKRVDAFFEGGAKAEAVLKQGLGMFLPAINAMRAQSGAQYAATKNANANRGQRPAAQPNRVVKPATLAPGKTTASLKAEDGITPSTHQAAWDIAKKYFSPETV